MPRLCEPHKLPVVERGMCTECLDQEASYEAFVEDMRGLRYRTENDFGAGTEP